MLSFEADGCRFGGIALCILAFLLLATFPGWHEEKDARTGSDIDIKPFPSRPVTLVCLFALGMAALFLLTSAIWQHVAAASAATAISSATQGCLSGHVGPAATALVWIAFILVFVSFVAIAVMVYSIKLLDRLTND